MISVIMILFCGLNKVSPDTFAKIFTKVIILGAEVGSVLGALGEFSSGSKTLLDPFRGISIGILLGNITGFFTGNIKSSVEHV